MDGLMDEQMEGLMDEQMECDDEWMTELVDTRI